MFERFTDMSRRAVAIANQQTHRLGGQVIGDREMLLGMLDCPDSVSSRVLAESGVSADQVRAAIITSPAVRR